MHALYCTSVVSEQKCGGEFRFANVAVAASNAPSPTVMARLQRAGTHAVAAASRWCLSVVVMILSFTLWPKRASRAHAHGPNAALGVHTQADDVAPHAVDARCRNSTRRAAPRRARRRRRCRRPAQRAD